MSNVTITARKALGVTAEDITVKGLTALSISSGNGLARFALAIFLAQESGLDRAEIITATGLYKGRVSTLYRAGEIISRCGAGAGTVGREAAALCEGRGSKATTDALGGLTGAKLVAAVKAEVKAMRAEKAEKATRGAGAETAAEKGTPSKPRTTAAILADVAADLARVAEVTAAESDAVEAILAHALRLAAALDIDVADVVARAESIAAEVADAA